MNTGTELSNFRYLLVNSIFRITLGKGVLLDVFSIMQFHRKILRRKGRRVQQKKVVGGQEET